MTTFHILGSLALVGLFALLLAAFRGVGYRSGWDRGYEMGRRDETIWWKQAELQVDEARQKIWREE